MTAVKITITEALAELNTINKRLERKRASVLPYIVRDMKMVDPMAKSGGSEKFIKEERQGIRDLEKRIIQIRTAIQKANLVNKITLGDQEMTVAEWLTWRREVSEHATTFLRQLNQSLMNARAQLEARGGRVIAAAAASVDMAPGDKPQAVVNLDEKGLLEEQESMEKLLGDLDGKLSLFNATQTIELAA